MLYDPKWEKKHRAQQRAERRKWTLPKLYNAAADAIETHGHSKGLLGRPDGSMCLWGAMAFVVEGDPQRTDSTYKKINPLYEFTGDWSPIAWNNAPERTKEDVVNMLRHAARVIAARAA